MWSAYRKEAITWRRHLGVDPWGTPLGFAEEGVLARVEWERAMTRVHWRNRMVRDQNGNEVTCRGALYVGADQKPSMQDRYVLDTGEVRVAAITPVRSFSRVTGYRVAFS